MILAIDFKQIGDEYQKHKAKEQGRKRRKQTMFKAGEAQKLGLLGALAAGEQVSAVAEEREVMLAGGATGASVSEGACFELYSEYRGETTRLSVPFVRLNYSGLGDKKRGSTRENLDTLQMLLLERFEQAKYDNRLVGVTYRPPVRAGVSLDILLQPAKLPGGVDKRAELGSRLTYMACRHNA